MKRLLYLLLPIALAGAQARGSPYSIEYDPTNGLFPEQVGWTRFTGYGGAQRWFEGGLLVVDSRASLGIYDYQVMERPGAIDPGPGETFFLEWRVVIDELVGYHDIGIGVYSDRQWAVGFHVNPDVIQSVFEPGVEASFAPAVLHDFRLTSSDMRSYLLCIDGVPAISGSLSPAFTASRVTWGDGVQGGASLSHWGYVRFGMVPEPPTALAGTFLVVLTGRGTLRARSQTSRRGQPC